MCAQEITPSEQAQGYLQNKNVGVDYCTGIFNYKIPLWELSSGAYKVPVYLSYSTMGIKSKDWSGICGEGWNLICGGVVTRTIRGGFADEVTLIGYADNQFSDIDNTMVKLVNTRKKDGESDIFTATFGNQRINFVLEEKNRSEVRAVPLEKTNIKIEDNYKGNISSWIITDENGIKYVFGEKEETQEITMESGVSRNSIVNQSYISAWYLNEIIIPNSDTIHFSYIDRYTTESNTPVYYRNSYGGMSKAGYEYGISQEDLNFSLEEYQDEIDLNLSLIREHAAKLNLEAQANVMDKFRNQLVDQERLYVASLVGKIMGLTTDLQYLRESSNAAIQAINSLIGKARNINTATAQLLVSELEWLKRCYILAFNGRKIVPARVVTMSGSYKIYMKYLSRVYSNHFDMVFNYTNYSHVMDGTTRSGYAILKDITLLSYLRDTIAKVGFDISKIYSHEVLNKITISGNDSQMAQIQEFDYYDLPVDRSGKDIWGYYNGRSMRTRTMLSLSASSYSHVLFPGGDFNQLRVEVDSFSNRTIDSVYVKALSLKQIKTSSGAKINIDYESNELYGEKHAGIRVKSLNIDNGLGQQNKIKYYYQDEYGNGTGILAWTGLSSSVMLDYGYFQDYVLRSDIQKNGVNIINDGNNGLFYHYVREEFEGNGNIGRYFFVPILDNDRFPTHYPYWLYGLPIGKIIYDTYGQMVWMEKNVYYTNMINDAYAFYQSLSFIDQNGPFSFSNFFRQLQPYEYYIDAEKIGLEFSKNLVELYKDNGIRGGIIPYNDIYLPNLEPRTNIRIPDQKYLLYYGGKVVPKEHQEYHFESVSQATRTPRIDDLYDPLPANAFLTNKETYLYGTNHCNPIGIVSLSSDGSEKMQIVKSVLDIQDNVDPVIDEMKANNIFAPVIIQQNFLKKNANNCLISETVNTYKSLSSNSGRIYVPFEELSISMKSPVARNPLLTGKETSLFSQSRSLYRQEQVCSYQQCGKWMRLVSKEKPNEVNTVVFDKGNDRVILEATNVESGNIDAIDKYRASQLMYAQKAGITGDIGYYPSGYTNLISFLSDFVARNDMYSRRSQVKRDEFFKGSLYQNIDEFARLLLNGKDYSRILELQNILYGEDIWDILAQYQDFVDRMEALDLDLDFSNYIEWVEYVMYNTESAVLDENSVSSLLLYGKQDIAGLTYSQNLVINVNENRNYQLSIVQNNSRMWMSTCTLNYDLVFRDGQKRTYSVSYPIPPNVWKLVSVDIDLTQVDNHQNVVRIEVRVPDVTDNKYATIVLAPVGVEYEACSYDSMGMLFCKFNHQGQMERYEYDSLGRIIKIYDQSGNLLQENEYNDLTIVN